MLSEIELDQYFDRHNLSPHAVQYILSTRSSPPSRMVGVHARKNVCSWIYSEKMQRTISAESRTAEKAFVLLSEFDTNVLEMWDQPEPVAIKKHTRKGRLTTSSYTPDFLLLEDEGPVVVEVKPAETLKKLESLFPKDWVQRGGDYDFLPARQRFFELGLAFRVFVASPDLRFRVANLELLLRAREAAASLSILDQEFKKAYDESFCWSLYDLRERLQLKDYTALLHYIHDKKLFFDWDHELLSEPRGCHVVRHPELLPYVTELQGGRIYRDNLLNLIHRERVPSSAYAKRALERLERVRSGDKGRSVRRWRTMIEKGRLAGLTPLQSLVPQLFYSGNNRRKINADVERFLVDYLMNVHATRQGISDYRSWIDYRVHAKEMHPEHPPVARGTFIRRLQSIPPEVIALKRGGRRAANAVEGPSDPRRRHLKADLAWQRAAIDHYKGDIYLAFFDADEFVYAMKPWLTIMVDLATGCVLAFSVSFRDPSRMSVAKVMRDCVRRHGQLPREIIVDRGADFRSVYFATLLSHCKVELAQRPAGHSRYGGEVEGFFGEFKKVWLSQRPGNTANFKEVRGVDGKLKPNNRAVLTPYDFYREIEAFLSWRDASRPRGVGLTTPKAALDKHMDEYPFVAVKQEYDDEFLLASAVESADYKLDFQRGIHINGMWYSAPDLMELRGKKSGLEVRVDPENPHVIYGLVRNRWVPCYGSNINRYAALDPISQWEEGLIAIDAYNARQNVKQQADEDLVRIIRSMSADAGKPKKKSKLAILPEVEDADRLEQPSIFDLLKTAEIQTLENDEWEVKHVWEH